VITDGWTGYLGIDKSATRMIGAVNAPPRPWARTSAICCRECTASRPWPNGGCFPPTKGRCTFEHLPGYLTSSAFGFNRRRSRSRGLVFYRVLQLAIGHDPVRYQQLIARSKPKTIRSAPPGSRGPPA